MGAFLVKDFDYMQDYYYNNINYTYQTNGVITNGKPIGLSNKPPKMYRMSWL